jgi:hypothetical protein
VNLISEKKLKRLRELSKFASGNRDTLLREFTMRIPAEPDRDADLVLSWAADEIELAHKALRDIIACRGGHSAPERMRNIARETLQTKDSK